MDTKKYNEILLITKIIIFGLIFLSACSKNITPPEGLIVDQTVGENASNSGFANQMQDQKSSSFGSVPFPKPDKEASAFGKGARLSDLEFNTTSDLKDIYFKFDQYYLDDASREILNKNATFLKIKSPIAKIEIQGHCDERGTNNYNISLAERRAKSTKIYLVSLGVDPKRIHTISFGEESPLCTDNTEVCWSKNRRAHFRVSS